MYYQQKRGGGVLTVEQLVGMGREAHGRTLWIESSTGKREPVFFDSEMQECVSLAEFRRRQKNRAETRARSYPNGRSKVSASRRSGNLYSSLYGE